jgi:hypothetical protein
LPADRAGGEENPVGDLEALALSYTPEQAIEEAAPGLPAALLPPSPDGAYDVATAEAGGRRISLIAAHPGKASTWLRPVESIEDAAQLPEGVLLVSRTAIRVSLETPSPLAFDFRWLREVAAGVLRGTTGLRVNASGNARLALALDGAFEVAALREGEMLRVVVRRAASERPALAVKAGITASCEMPLPERGDELFAALTGTHGLDWLRTALKEIGSVRWKWMAADSDASNRTFEKLAEAWRGLTASAESAVWEAMGEAGRFDELRGWAVFLAAPETDAAALAERLREAFESDPGFAATAAGRWLETALGMDLFGPWTGAVPGRARRAAEALLRIPREGEAASLLENLRSRAADELDLRRPGAWMRDRLAELLGAEPWTAAGSLTETVKAKLEAWHALRDRVYAKAGAALARKLSAEVKALLERMSPDEALADASVPADADGLKLFRRLAGGDLTPLFQPGARCRMRYGVLTHVLRRRRPVEVVAPFLNRLEWRGGVNSVASAEVRDDDAGRLSLMRAGATSASAGAVPGESALVFGAAFSSRDQEPADDLATLSFTDARTVGPRNMPAWLAVLRGYGIPAPDLRGGPARAVLALTVPGTAAEAWCGAPHSKDPDYQAVMTRVSTAVQTAMRRWIPALWLVAPERYRELSAVQPLLVYACSAPFVSRNRGEFGYDIMDSDALTKAAFTAAKGLEAALAGIEKELRDRGQDRLASVYAPKQARSIISAALSQRRNLQNLLAGDSALVEEIVHLAASARELRALSVRDPKDATRRLGKFIEGMVRAFHRKLRRLSAGTELQALGPLVLAEATAALAGLGPAAVAARLTISRGGRDEVYLNEAARAAA